MNRLHPLSAVTLALRRALAGLFVALTVVTGLAAFVDFVSGAWMTVAVPLGFLLGGTYGIVYYFRFEYEITDTTFDVSSGVFSRRSREIPYRRIQNVDVRVGILQRLLGLAVVSIETAGGGNTEAVLNFVSEEEANRLQREIRRRTAKATETQEKSSADDLEDVPAADSESARDRNEAGDPIEHPDETVDGRGGEPSVDHESPSTAAQRRDHAKREKSLFGLEARELLLYSFTSFRPAVGAALLFFVFIAIDPVINHLLTVAQPVGGPEDLETGTAGNYGILTAVSFVYAVAVTYLVSVAYTFATYYGFKLSRAGQDFVYERGLVQRYSGSIPAEKIQSVTVTDNPLQRLIDYAGMWIETAGYGPESSSGSQSAVPLARKSRVYEFTERLTGAETPKFLSPPELARRRYLARYSIIAGVIVAIAFGVSLATTLEQWYLAAIVFLAVPPAAHLRYVNIQYFVGEDHLVVRRGFWRRRTTVIPYYRIQTVSTRRSVFQRRLGLASVVVDTASSSSFSMTAPTIYDLELEDARDVNITSRKQLQRTLRERAQDDDLGLTVDFT
ncbi:PH domain-containing protein [Halostagnicola sp. A-GB9-2]|uniref:PH domain-containing protein n=1 Tax=Halostagnicola sp. A-GB9-2 TaxID=3048066 RepID=UPI0024C08979|nr:PH domain-containing protein [Halostagnicola sp. A-GB9-2]MDJ1433339.1 PH domain-containing protein [Halostagnicola sp. A-GB9-2]